VHFQNPFDWLNLCIFLSAIFFSSFSGFGLCGGDYGLAYGLYHHLHLPSPFQGLRQQNNDSWRHQSLIPSFALLLLLNIFFFLSSSHDLMFAFLLLFPLSINPTHQLKSLQQQGKPLTLGEKASTYGLMGVGGVLGLVGVAISILKQFTTVLG